MKTRIIILFLTVLSSCLSVTYADDKVLNLHFDFYGHTIDIQTDNSVVIPYSDKPTSESVQAFYDKLNAANYQPIIDKILRFKEEQKLNDWFYYQLIRRTAQELAPKAENYPRYTLYKWFFLAKVDMTQGWR